MLRRKQLLWAVVSLVVISSPSVWAMDMDSMKDISGEVSVDYFGKYIWRGQVLTDDPVLQPAVTLTCPEGKLSFNIWGNVDLTGYRSPSTRNDFTEMDYTLDYSDALPGVDGVGYSVGLIDYTFGPASIVSVHDTSEIYAGLSFEKCPFNPTATFYYDIDEASGLYCSLGISRSLDISEMGMGMQDMADSVAEGMLSTVDLSASLGIGNNSYNTFYWGKSDDRINDLVLSAAVPVKVCDYCTITGSVNYVTLLDGSIRAANTPGLYTGDGVSDIVYGGVGVVVPF